ncbi:ribonuclease H-like domain-containing protein [Tanacetum coccineum]
MASYIKPLVLILLNKMGLLPNSVLKGKSPYELIKHGSVKKPSHDLDHVNFFDEVVHEGPDTSCDDNDLSDQDQGEGSNSIHFSSPTIDHFEDELENPKGSNGFASENEMAATSNPNVSLSEDDNLDTLNTKHDQNLDNKPLRRKAIGEKWVFKIKYKSNGELERYKARYVVKGYNQKEGIDFDETFSPVVKIVTVRCVINLAVQNNWTLYQLDINNAFLYGELYETVYMDLPEGFYSLDDKRVCKLKKSLYGLKQAPMQWNAKLTQTLTENGFKQSKSDYFLFTKSENGNFYCFACVC